MSRVGRREGVVAGQLERARRWCPSERLHTWCGSRYRGRVRRTTRALLLGRSVAARLGQAVTGGYAATCQIRMGMTVAMGVPATTPETRTRRRVGRWRMISRHRLLVSVCAALAAALFACADDQPRHPRETDTSGYVFDHVSVRGRDEGAMWVATVGWDAHWRTAEFPGVRRCTWSVSDADGGRIGIYTDNLTIMQDVAENLELSIETSGRPAAASMTCEPDRLDVGGPYSYEISKVEALAPEREGDPWRLRYDARWQGDGAAGPVTCVAELIESSGGPSLVDEVNIFAADGVASAGEISFPGSSTLGPDVIQGGRISQCRPFGG